MTFEIKEKLLGPKSRTKLTVIAKLKPFQEALLKEDCILRDWILCTFPDKCRLVIIKANQLQNGTFTILLPAGHDASHVETQLKRNLEQWFMATMVMNSFDGAV